MKIALIGYGKMGKAIEQIALERNHEIVARIGAEWTSTDYEGLKSADVAIEFSVPAVAVENIYKCFDANVPVVVGTTGWYDAFDSVSKKCATQKAGLFYATNFSVGVNLFFELNKQLAKLMNNQPDYDVTMEEIHHIHKLDAPSGTAITLAEGTLGILNRKESWVKENASAPTELAIASKRIDEVPGTHSITYESDIDQITITHEAKSRKGFAQGAVIAAEWMKDKVGVFTMTDLLSL